MWCVYIYQTCALSINSFCLVPFRISRYFVFCARNSLRIRTLIMGTAGVQAQEVSTEQGWWEPFMRDFHHPCAMFPGLYTSCAHYEGFPPSLH